MLRSVKDLIGYPVEATDGKAGKVKDILFGDRQWKMRYLEVQTKRRFHLNLGHRFGEREGGDTAARFLVESGSLGPPSMGLDRRSVPVRLTRGQIFERPCVGNEVAMEDKFDLEFRRFFRRSFYNEKAFSGTYAGSGYIPSPAAYEHSEEDLQEHLRRMDEIAGERLHSAKAILGYHVCSGEESLGSAVDLILNVETWSIDFLVVSAHRGFPSRKYLLPISDLVDLDWSSAMARMRLGLEAPRDDDRYHPFDAVNRDEEGQMHDYCGRPCLRNLMEQIY